MRLTIRQIMEATGGVLTNNAFSAASVAKVALGVATDSRKPMAGQLFVPLAGPRFDGHTYLSEAAANGAACALTERDIPYIPVPEDFPLIKVASTHQALLELAAYYRRLFNIPITAVTGSAGKTTTKDMIASVLSQKYSTLKTEGNLNNEIGLPLTLFKLTEAHEAAVLEMGMNHTGEIRRLSQTANPKLAVITNIGDAHIENLGSREGILKAKLEILDGMEPDGMIVLNGDDPMLAGLKGMRWRKERTVYCYTHEAEAIHDGRCVCAVDIEPLGLNGTRCRIDFNGHLFPVHIPLPGNHMVMNALLATAVGLASGLTTDEIAAGLAAFKPSHDRMDLIRANEMTIINDAYNANPESMKAAVSVLAGLNGVQGRKVCLLGDMFELGDHAERLHTELGCHIAGEAVDLLVCVGSLAHMIYEGYTQIRGEGNALYYADKPSFLNEWRTVLRQGDAVLVKASRGMAFEEIVESLSYLASAGGVQG